MGKKKKLGVIINGVIGFAIGGALGVYGVEKIINLGVEPWLFFVLVGIMYIWIFIEINIHEFGHFIFGKISNYKLLRYAVGPLNWQYENGKMKFKVERNKGFAGLCAMIPCDGIDKKQHMLFIAGGVLMNTLSLIPLIIGKAVVEGAFCSITITFMIVITVFLIVINSVPIKAINPSSDGNVFFGLLGDKPSAIISLKLLNMSVETANGIRPRNVDMKIEEEFGKDKINELQYRLMKVFKALDMNDIEAVKSGIEFIEENIDVIPAFLLPAYLYEIIYYYSAIDLNEEKANKFYDKAKKGLIKDKDINGRRVLASYRLYIEKDKEAARQLCEDGLKVIESYPLKGQVFLETDIINKMLLESSAPIK